VLKLLLAVRTTFVIVLFLNENSEEQQATWLFFRSSSRWRPRISAKNETSMADHALQRTAKTAVRRMTSRCAYKGV
jgi:hypothetical protein